MLVEVSPSSSVMRFVAHTCLHLFRHGSCYAHTLGMEFYSSTRQLQPQAGAECEAQFSTVCIAIYSNYVNECTRKMPSKWRSPEQTYRIAYCISIRRCDNFSNYRTKYHIIHCSHTLGVLCRNFVLLISILKLTQLNNYLVFVVYLRIWLLLFVRFDLVTPIYNLLHVHDDHRSTCEIHNSRKLIKKLFNTENLILTKAFAWTKLVLDKTR